MLHHVHQLITNFVCCLVLSKSAVGKKVDEGGESAQNRPLHQNELKEAKKVRASAELMRILILLGFSALRIYFINLLFYFIFFICFFYFV